jgi:hypothetical protein
MLNQTAHGESFSPGQTHSPQKLSAAFTARTSPKASPVKGAFFKYLP